MIVDHDVGRDDGNARIDAEDSASRSAAGEDCQSVVQGVKLLSVFAGDGFTRMLQEVGYDFGQVCVGRGGDDSSAISSWGRQASPPYADDAPPT